ncbi:MAG: thioredoxin family protein [Candidatus Melainabacteria bacterium]|nr:thioredoxin family protein [Candidatus Melainabacteria bacterium]
MRNHFRSNLLHSFAALLVLAAPASGLFAAPANGQTVSKTAAVADAAPTVGKPAPAFSLKDWDGKTRKLADYKGKIVVLEWFNHGCPFVKKHYDSSNMQDLQKTYTGKGVVWLSICSSAEGKQGYGTGEEHKKAFKEKGGAPTVVLIDSEGTVGRQYDAKTTPAMYVIDGKGVLVYAGAIDDNRTADRQAAKTAKNFVAAALNETLAKKQVAISSTKSYGCSIKYKQQ